MAGPYPQYYLDWIAGGAKHLTWTQMAEEAAKAAGLQQYQPWWTSGQYKGGNTPWSENQFFDPNSGDALGSIYNPAWTNFIVDWNARNPVPQAPTPGGPAQGAFGNPAGTAPATTPAAPTAGPKPALIQQLSPTLENAVGTKSADFGSELTKRLQAWAGG